LPIFEKEATKKKRIAMKPTDSVVGNIQRA